MTRCSPWLRMLSVAVLLVTTGVTHAESESAPPSPSIVAPSSDVLEADAASPEWVVTPDESLARQRGGLRVGSLDVYLNATVSNYLNGQEVSKVSGLEQLASVGALQLQGQGGLLADPTASVGSTVFQQGLVDGGLVFVLANTANDVEIRRDIDVDVRVEGFHETFGDAVDHANAALAASLADRLGGL